jgi:hypothetical protein
MIHISETMKLSTKDRCKYFAPDHKASSTVRPSVLALQTLSGTLVFSFVYKTPQYIDR